MYITLCIICSFNDGYVLRAGAGYFNLLTIQLCIFIIVHLYTVDSRQVGTAGNCFGFPAFRAPDYIFILYIMLCIISPAKQLSFSRRIWYILVKVVTITGCCRK